MLRSTFLKTLYEKRWVIFWWSLAVFITNTLLIQIFPPIRDAFSGMVESMPAALQGWFGEEGDSWSTIEGYVSMEVMGQMSLVMIVFAVIFSTSILASEESSGLLISQLSKSISRTSYFLQKYSAFLVACLVVIFFFMLGAFFGTVVLNDIIPLGDFLPPMFALYLLVVAFGSLTFSFGSIFANKSLPGVIIGFYATIGYFLTSMRTAAPIVDKLSHFTPFHFYNTPNVLLEGLDLGNVLVLLCFIVIPVVVALPIFLHRDLNTH